MQATALRPAADLPDVTLAGPARRPRGIEVPQLLVALLCVALFALAAVWWQARSTARQPVLAIAQDVAVGQPLTPADLMTVFVNVDQPVRLVEETASANFVGSIPIRDLPAGTLLSPEMFTTVRPLATGEALLGVIVEGNAQPGSLIPGDQVLAVIASSEADELPAIEATVEQVGSSNAQGQVVVRLRVRETDATGLAVAAANDQVVLIETPADPS